MSTSLGRLVLDMAVNAAGFERDMKKISGSAKKELNKVNRELRFAQRDLDAARAKVTTLATALSGLGALGIAAVGREFRQFAQEADALDKVSRTVSLTVEELQELRFAAEQAAGITSNTLDMAMQRFARRVGEAANNTGELNTIVKELGVDLRNADGSLRSQTELLGIFADEIANAESEQEALRIAFKLFDSEGARMVTLLRQGSGAIDELREQFRSTGAVISGETVDATVRFNDAMNVLGQNIAGLRNEFMAGLVEPLADYADFLANTEQGQETFRRLLENIGNTAQTLGIIIGVGFTGALIKASVQMAAAELRVARLTAQKLALNGASRTAAVGVTLFGRAVSIATGPVGIITGILATLGVTYLSVRDTMAQAAVGFEDFESSLTSASEEVSGFQQRIEQARQSTSQFRADQISADLEQLKRIIADLDSEINTLETQQRRFSNQFGASSVAAQGAAERINELRQEQQKLRQSADALNDQLDSLNNTTEAGVKPTRELADSAETLAQDMQRQIERLRAEKVELAGGTRALLNYRIAKEAANGATAEQIAHLEQLRDSLIAEEAAVETLRQTMEDANDERERAEQLAAESEQSYRDLAFELQNQTAEYSLSGRALDEFRRAQFIATQEQRLSTAATAEQREEIRRLAGDLFDAANAASGFAQKISSALEGILPDNIAQAVGKGLEDGIASGIGAINSQDLLDGNFRQIGIDFAQTALSTAGQAIGSGFGPIGGAIGGLIGDVLGNVVGGLFGSDDPEFSAGGSRGDNRFGADEVFDGPLGPIAFGFNNIEQEAQRQIIDAFIQMDQSLAAAVRSRDFTHNMRVALENWSVETELEGADLVALMESRFDQALSTLPDAIADYINELGGTLEQRVQALADVFSLDRMLTGGRTLGLGAADGLLIGNAGGQSFAAGGPETVATDFNAQLTATLEVLSIVRIGTESLTQTFERLSTVMQSLDQASALMGAQFAATRQDAIIFGADLVALFGDNPGQLSGALGRIFSAFYTEAERAEAAAEVAGAEATRLLGLLGDQIGMTFDESALTASGFRELFETLTQGGTLTAEQTALLIRAGVAVADYNEAQNALNGATDEATDAINRRAEALRLEAEARDFLNGIQEQTLEILAPTWAQYNQLSQAIAENLAEARDLANSEQALAAVRRLAQLQNQQFVAQLRASITDLTDQLFGGGSDPFQSMARSVGSAAQSIGDSITSALQGVQDWLDGQFFSDASSATPLERLNEAQRQFDATIAAARAGDAGAIADLPALADQLLGQGASFFGTSADGFIDLESQVRAAMEQIAGISAPDMRQPTFGQTQSIVDATQSTQRSALEQAQLASQLVQEIALLSRITGDTPTEIGEEFGIPIADLIGAVTGELPDLTGDALSTYFNDLVGSVEDELTVLLDMQAVQDAELALLKSIDATLRTIADNPASQQDPGETLRDPLANVNETLQADSASQREELRAIRAELERISDRTEDGNADRRRGIAATEGVAAAVNGSTERISRAVRESQPRRRGAGA